MALAADKGHTLEKDGRYQYIKSVYANYFGIGNKILLVVLLVIFLFSVGLSISVGMTSFGKFSDIAMSELVRMSTVFAKKVEELENDSVRLVETFNGNKQFLGQMKQLSSKGPLYALEPALMDRQIEESERVYFLQSQIKLIDILLPLLNVNGRDTIVLYLTSPFNMAGSVDAVPVLKINRKEIFINQFRSKGRGIDNAWYKIKLNEYIQPSSDYFDISSVYSLPVRAFLNDLGFMAVEGEMNYYPIPEVLQGDKFDTEVGVSGGNAVLTAWHSVAVEVANPQTFEEETVVTGYILVEQQISQRKIDRFAAELGMKLGIALRGELLMANQDKGKKSLLGKEKVTVDGVEYYFSDKQIKLRNFSGLSAVTMSPVSRLNDYAWSLSVQIVLTGVVAMLIAGLLIFFIVQAQIRIPLNKLMRGVTAIAEGKFEAHVEIDTKDEFGRLADSFNEMSSILNKKTEILYRTVAELEKAQNYIGNIIDSMPSILVGVDGAGKVTQWNQKAVEILGISVDDAKGRALTDVYPQMESELKGIAKSIESQRVIRNLRRMRSTAKGNRYEDVTIYPLVANGAEGAVIRIDDTTESVQLEEIMIQSEKMLSVGGLAAGMAHEINNPLAGMIQTAGVMANRLGKHVDMTANIKAAKEAGTSMESIKLFMEARGIPRMIATINKSGARVATIVDNMLSFARKSEGRSSTHSLPELFDKTLELASTDYDLKKRYDFRMIEIKMEYEENLPQVACEGSKIQQVLLNILRNGAQAMQQAEIKRPCFVVRVRFEKERRMICMEIEDNGPGMDDETRKRVFEPFFTTKAVGDGTGLGLSVAYFIITENHSGEMSVESQIGFGAKFIISLPVSGQEV